MTAGNNWGRWGSADERGALNTLTNDLVVDAAKLVKTGRVYPLGRPLQSGAASATSGRAAQHFMTLDGGDYAAGLDPKRTPVGQAFADDVVLLPVHGAGTHVDALCHVWEGGELYNGHSANSVRSYGATRCGIENAPGFVTRGVLLDIAGMAGETLAAGSVIGREQLQACCALNKITRRPGDAVLIRTGASELDLHSGDREPGIDVGAAEFLVEWDVAVVGADNTALEPVGQTHGAGGMASSVDVHLALLHRAGVYIVELLDLDGLAGDGIHEFLFVMAPLQIRGATGSPVNPLAIA